MEPKNEDSIQVFIRVRPDRQEESLVTFTDSQIRLDKNHFGFDRIFPPSASQFDIFQAVGQKVLTHALDGYNACIFVYGQTGSGKTYTMMGENNGLMQRSFSQLFTRIYQMQNTECNITCSYFEIYNEQIIDLLDLKKDKKMNIRQDSKRGVFVQNLVQQPINNQTKLSQCLLIGMKNRHVGQTLMNRQSSRSHSIFTVSLSLKSTIDGKKTLKTPKLHFVDLAGSERQKMTAASGDRLKEAGNINKSLTTLGMVINALTSEKPRNHIPYRDSKLTNLLRDSLGGNSKTFIIATISCSVLCFHETLSTLNFANRAKMVKVKAHINEESLSTNIETYKDEIKRLKAEILKLKQEKQTPTIEQKEIIREVEKMTSETRSYDDQFKEINSKIENISDHITKNPISPTLESLIDHIQKIKLKKFSTISTIDETDELLLDKADSESEDVFIEYLNNNNQLLEQIHKKIDEYIELKGQLRNITFHDQLNVSRNEAEIQKQNYEELLSQRQEEIIELYEQIKKLNEELTQHGTKIKQLKKQAFLNSNQIEQKEFAMETIRNSLLSLENEAILLRKMLSQAHSEKEKITENHEQIKKECDEKKKLYFETEEKLNQEKQLKKRIEESLKDKMKEIKELDNEYRRKMENIQEKFQEKEEQLLQQIELLSQSVEFNKRLVSDFQFKFQTQQDDNENLEYKLKETQNILNQTETQLQEKMIQLKNLQAEYNIYVKKAENQYEKIKESLEESIQKYNQMCCRFQFLQKTKEQQISEYCQKIHQAENQLRRKMEIISDIEEKYNEDKVKHRYETKMISEQHQMEMQLMKNKMVEEEKEYEEEIRRKELLLQKQKEDYGILQVQHKTSIEQKKNIIQENCQIKTKIMEKEKEIHKVRNEKNTQCQKLNIQNEEYKKNFTDLTTENCKLRVKLNGNVQKNNGQLVSKVNFYEEKFKVMSLQYQQAMDVVKKLKEKELNQHKKINYLQENQKYMKIVSDTDYEKQTTKQLLQENKKLKQQIEIIKQKNPQNQTFYEKVCLEQQKQMLNDKEEEFKTLIVNALVRQNSSKQNISKDRSLHDLLNDWQKAEGEKKRQHENLIKGIRREQKIKSQNSCIEKENIYLRERLYGPNEMEGVPRKRVKLDEEIE